MVIFLPTLRGSAPQRRRPAAVGALAVGLALALVGCGTRATRAPVEERSPTPRVSVAAASPAYEPAVPVPRPVPEVLKSGSYVVKPGDTLIRIGMDNGQNWKDLVRWNSLSNPNLIEVGQVLRVAPPGSDPAATTTRP
ncbi:MAG: LysM peptidoglycan-binding domain-containing protein, partial [Pseudomonadota bacterium]|nr:LysM peptidoglycan-binding domain-containing protein [Pseudomonadota bacterium]